MPMGALRNILRQAGTGSPEEPIFTGSDPVVQTPYRVGTAGAAALAAVGLAASDLWQLRTGRRQKIAVNVRAAALSLRSSRYLRLDGKPFDSPWDPLSGIYPTRDGRFIYFHCNFPNHRDAMLSVLGTAPERAAAAGAASRREAAELEEAVVAAGGVGVMVRSAAEWAEHPQAAAVAELPLLEIVRIGDAPREPLPDGDRPLAGIRVLDLTRVLAGPTCARTLAEHGADVLKIAGPHLPHSGWIEYDTGHGKLSAHLDLREAAGRDRLRGLAREADVFSQSFRPGALDDRGFSPEELMRLRPGIVCVTLSAFGHRGPWAARRGFDTVVQAVSGMAVQQGGSKGPRFLPVSAIDYVSGYLMAFGAMVALARRATEGGSWLVRVSLAQTGHWIAGQGVVDPAALATVPEDAPEPEIAALSVDTETPMGRLRHLGPAVQLSETPAHWLRPAVPLGYHPADWPR
ncbi:CoA transferase [Desertibaculum subflavum]|uniref:CoA transferase n=1 Tax=Desertibaculum subflavum TaxID=2268458 RepID=UPI000E66C127